MPHTKLLCHLRTDIDTEDRLEVLVSQISCSLKTSLTGAFRCIGWVDVVQRPAGKLHK